MRASVSRIQLKSLLKSDNITKFICILSLRDSTIKWIIPIREAKWFERPNDSRGQMIKPLKGRFEVEWKNYISIIYQEFLFVSCRHQQLYNTHISNISCIYLEDKACGRKYQYHMRCTISIFMCEMVLLIPRWPLCFDHVKMPHFAFPKTPYQSLLL